jgi:poly(3-hydroxybutyrate) depolymerase
MMAAMMPNLDPARVLMTGLSNGGFFTTSTGCRDQNAFRGFAPVSGGMRTPACASTHAHPYIGFNAKTDEIIPYAEGQSGAKLWAQTNHCKNGPNPSLTFGGPSTDPRTICLASGPGFTPPWRLVNCSHAGAVSTCQTWDQCDDNVKVTFCTINADTQLAGGHVLYFNDTHVSLAAVAWEFFKESLPTGP